MIIEIKTTDNYKLVATRKSLIAAIRYILKHDKSDGWYHLNAHMNGNNDIHVFTLVEIAYIIASIKDDEKTLEILADEFKYHLSPLGMDLNTEDYEEAREIAEYILGYSLKDVKIQNGIVEGLEPETKVIFRFWQNEVIALFPEFPSDYQNYNCLSYMHQGQHSSADGQMIIDDSRLALPNEYDSLKTELESIGYRLSIKKRYTYKMVQALQSERKRLRQNRISDYEKMMRTH